MSHTDPTSHPDADPDPDGAPPRPPVDPVRRVMRRILVISALLVGGLALVGSVVGGLVAGGPGVAGALAGAGMAFVFQGLTVLTVQLTSRSGPTMSLGVIMGAWVLKVVAFMVLVIALHGSPHVAGPVLFLTLVAAVLGTLAVDVVTVLRGRIPVVDDPVGHR